MNIEEEDEGRNISIYSETQAPEAAFLTNKKMVKNA